MQASALSRCEEEKWIETNMEDVMSMDQMLQPSLGGIPGTTIDNVYQQDLVGW